MPTAPVRKKRRLSAAGRKAIIEATKQRCFLVSWEAFTCSFGFGRDFQSSPIARTGPIGPGVTMLDGMPEYGVTLSGSVEEPVLENNSGRVVIGYDMKLANANGREMILSAQIMATSGQPGGIPDGGAIYVHGNVPVTLAGQVHVLSPFHSTSLAGPMQSRPVQEFSPGQRPIVNAALVSVIFADGQFVGVDEYGVFESFGRRIKVMVQVGLLAKAGTWDQIESLANALSQSSLRSPSEEDPGLYFERRAAAMFLVQEREQKGDAAAAQLAEIYSSLPTPWRN